MSDTEPVWFKSLYSGTAGDNCVEVATIEGAVLVRDSKDLARPHVTVNPQGWAQFIEYAAQH
ncbi:DUF397 domain-containing protein [Streptomyces sp. NPDC051018]|uniref:DUF397 domain-containing protein n=1 Tax=Streptomyces sp. NPDC051018 TaxID=3365639 RepID=UPI00379AA2E1